MITVNIDALGILWLLVWYAMVGLIITAVLIVYAIFKGAQLKGRHPLHVLAEIPVIVMSWPYFVFEVFKRLRDMARELSAKEK